MAGTALHVGRALESVGWDVALAFEPLNTRVPVKLRPHIGALRVLRAIPRHRPDLVIASSADGTFVPMTGVPLISHSHGLEHRRRQIGVELGLNVGRFGVGHRVIREPSVRLAARHARALVVLTESDAHYARARFGLSEERVRVIPCGVEDSWFEAEPARSERPIVLWIAGWTQNKGRDDLATILGHLVALRPDVELHVLGTGVPSREVLDAFPFELRHHVRVTESASRADVLAACREASVGLMTSRYEGFGKAIIEYLASGLPVVCTPVGAAPDLVAAGAPLDIVAVPELRTAAEMLAAKMRLDDADRADVARRARSVARAFRLEVAGARWIALVDEVMDAASSRHRR
jgi:glycosyltransferase involved in cell wall biosynthesis